MPCQNGLSVSGLTEYDTAVETTEEAERQALDIFEDGRLYEFVSSVLQHPCIVPHGGKRQRLLVGIRHGSVNVGYMIFKLSDLPLLTLGQAQAHQAWRLLTSGRLHHHYLVDEEQMDDCMRHAVLVSLLGRGLSVHPRLWGLCDTAHCVTWDDSKVRRLEQRELTLTLSQDIQHLPLAHIHRTGRKYPARLSRPQGGTRTSPAPSAPVIRPVHWLFATSRPPSCFVRRGKAGSGNDGSRRMGLLVATGRSGRVGTLLCAGRHLAHTCGRLASLTLVLAFHLCFGACRPARAM
jgi:hypothetical protein